MTRATRAQESPGRPSSNPDPKTLAAEILKSLNYRLGKNAASETEYDWLTASISVVRNRVVERWMEAPAAYAEEAKRVYYFSLEFLIGRLMRDAITNLGLMERHARGARTSLGVDLDVIAARARRGARQWRPRPACGVLPRVHGDDRHPGLRLRHPLRATASSARRSPTAGRSSCPRMAGARQPLGVRAAARARIEIGFGGPLNRSPPGTDASSAMTGSPRSTCWRSPSTRRSSAGAATASTRCGCGRRSRSIRSSSTSSTRATTSARSPRAPRPTR